MTPAAVPAEIVDFHRWLAELRAGQSARFGADDRLGTANHIDADARLRGAACIRTGEAVSLARPLVEGPGFHAESWSDEPGHTGFDRIETACHGYHKTHMDALNHISADGRFYGGKAFAEGPPTIVDLAAHGLFTRAVIADIPAVRATRWVSAEEPVTGADVDAALAGTEVLPGDALVLHMGRERWEAAGNELGHEPGHELTDGLRVPERKPGAGRSVARWIVEHEISIVAWDFADAVDRPELPRSAKGSVHHLIPAIGLVLVDNCRLASAAAAMARLGRRTAAFSVAPLAVPGGTGSVVTPWLLL